MSKEVNEVYQKRGYLKRDFEFFHIKDKRNMEFQVHYHDFNKILIFISGNVTYLIEGKAYKLKPWDILFVSTHEMHKVIIDDSVTYERIILWVNTDFLDAHSQDGQLTNCFELAVKRKFNLLRMDPGDTEYMKGILGQLENACKGAGFGNEILKNALFLQLLVWLNRFWINIERGEEEKDVIYDQQIGEVLEYINNNLEESLSIHELTERFYMSRSYLMKRFKNQTGYTIHSYIMQKRLIWASELLKQGKSSGEVCMECGFGDYSNFVRAFKKAYGVPPKEFYQHLYSQNHHNKQL